jgi:uncharacterized protein YegP (UPF0339 family)
MVFGQPHFLWALVLLLIPIIVHLLQFKKQNVFYFPGVFRLVEILKVSERKRNIKRWLILASRLLAFLFLVLYFADPKWEKEDQSISSTSRKYIVFIDASPSMHINQNGNIPLQDAKNKAIEWVSRLSENSEILVVHDLNQESSNQWNTKANAINAIRSIQKITFPYSIKQIYQSLEPALSSNQIQSLNWVIFTDAYLDFFEGLKTLPSNKSLVNIVKVKSTKIVNYALDSASLNATAQKLRVKVSRNSSDGSLSAISSTIESESPIVLKLIVADKVQSLKNIKWEENELTKWVEFEMIQAAANGYRFELSDDEFTADNVLYAHLPNRVTRKVTWAENTGIPSLDKLIKIQPNYFERIESRNPDDIDPNISAVFSLNTIRDWRPIEPWVKNENRIVIYPNSGGLEKLFNGKWVDASKGELRLSAQGLNEPMFRSAFDEDVKTEALLPSIKRYFELDENEKSNVQVHLSLSNGEPFLISRNINSGVVFVFLSDSKIGLKDFEKSTWFTPIITELILDRSSEFGSVYGDILSAKLLVLPQSESFDLQRPVSLTGNSDFQLTTGLQLLSGRLALAMDFDHFESGFFQLKDQGQKLTLGLNIPRKERSFELMNESVEEELIRRKWNWYDSDSTNWKDVAVDKTNSWFDFIVYLIILFFLTETLLIMPWFALKEVNSQNQS